MPPQAAATPTLKKSAAGVAATDDLGGQINAQHS